MVLVLINGEGSAKEIDLVLINAKSAYHELIISDFNSYIVIETSVIMRSCLNHELNEQKRFKT